MTNGGPGVRRGAPRGRAGLYGRPVPLGDTLGAATERISIMLVLPLVAAAVVLVAVVVPLTVSYVRQVWRS